MLVRELTDAIGDVVLESNLVVEKVAKLRAAGYHPIFFIENAIGLERIVNSTAQIVVKPLVEDGQVVEGTFSQEDFGFLKRLRIKLDGDTRQAGTSRRAGEK
jgi:UDP-3-O-[3-hydroxymyristoyl] glucosamine N-acyltransferase